MKVESTDNVPCLECCVQAAGEQEVAAGMPCSTGDAGRAASIVLQKRIGAQVPQLQSRSMAVEAAAGAAIQVWQEQQIRSDQIKPCWQPCPNLKAMVSLSNIGAWVDCCP